MEFCLNEATLQAYLDGELSPETLNGVALHLAACDTCAEAAHEAEAELALFNTAFAPVMQASVPTAHLRARLDEAIAELNAPHRQLTTRAAATMRVRSFFESLGASLTTFTPRQATAFASLLVAVALAVVFFALTGSPDDAKSSKQIAKNIETPAPANSAVRTDDGAKRGDQVAVQTPDEAVNAPAPARRNSSSGGGVDRPVLVKAGLNARTQVARARVEGNDLAAVPANAPAAPASEPVLEDEKTYLNSIASLTSAIEAQGAEAMTPTLRAEYARNLAVVNQAIVASRVAAHRNPQDTDAKEFLRAAYQNKVELLSAVADQTQLASGRD